MITQLNFQSIPVDDQQRALEFYRDMLGLKVHTDAPYGKDSRWIFMEFPGAETRIHFARRAEVVITDIPCLALACDDVDAECAALTAKGVAISSGPDEAPWKPGIRWAMIRDSEDNLILLESTKATGA